MLLRPSACISTIPIPSKGCHKSELATCLSTRSWHSWRYTDGTGHFKRMLLMYQGRELILPAGTLSIEDIYMTQYVSRGPRAASCHRMASGKQCNTAEHRGSFCGCSRAPLQRATCLCLPLPSCHVLECVWLVWVTLLRTNACLSSRHLLRTALKMLLLHKQYHARTL